MRIGQKATVISTGYVGTIEAIEEKKNGTWVQIDAKKYRDSNVICDYATPAPMPMITDENRQEFVDSCADGLTQEQVNYENPEVVIGETAPAMCQCGCGQVLAKKSSFRQGHDQRHRGNLLRRLERGDVDAGEELVRRNWCSRSEATVRLNKQTRKEARKAEGAAQAAPISA
jgi:hypothetical protein